jgi:isoaspartyl peptidase/L-asparaginase-like protein (Ntn-hydrolase superfamily)
VVLAKAAADFLRRPSGLDPNPSPAILPKLSTSNTASLAARQAVGILATRTHATGGLILLDRDGEPGFAYNTPRMAYGYVAQGKFVVGV